MRGPGSVRRAAPRAPPQPQPPTRAGCRPPDAAARARDPGAASRVAIPSRSPSRRGTRPAGPGPKVPTSPGPYSPVSCRASSPAGVAGLIHFLGRKKLEAIIDFLHSVCAELPGIGIATKCRQFTIFRSEITKIRNSGTYEPQPWRGTAVVGPQAAASGHGPGACGARTAAADRHPPERLARVALARIWLTRPTADCPGCPTAEDCRDRPGVCNWWPAAGGRPCPRPPSGRGTDGAFRHMPLGRAEGRPDRGHRRADRGPRPRRALPRLGGPAGLGAGGRNRRVRRPAAHPPRGGARRAGRVRPRGHRERVHGLAAHDRRPRRRRHRHRPGVRADRAAAGRSWNWRTNTCARR